ncbi:MAG: glycerol-3-phosphate 1-O-acyltransferase PlsY, partial [Gammaproteobacteria bacterium]
MQTKLIIDIALILFAYILGSISSAIVVCKIMRLPDPRAEGSGNPGATNVLRVGGKTAAIITLIGDILKGVIPVLIARACGVTDLALALVAFAAFVGHLYPVFFGFKGGRGVATAFGAILALSWFIALLALAVWILIAVVFRFSSLASICASISMPIFAYFLAN